MCVNQKIDFVLPEKVLHVYVQLNRQAVKLIKQNSKLELKNGAGRKTGGEAQPAQMQTGEKTKGKQQQFDPPLPSKRQGEGTTGISERAKLKSKLTSLKPSAQLSPRPSSSLYRICGLFTSYTHFAH